MKVEILSPGKKIFDDEAISVQMPGTAGLFEVLQNHAPLISSLSEGKIKVKTKSDTHLFDIKSGFVEVLRNNVSILIELNEGSS